MRNGCVKKDMYDMVFESFFVLVYHSPNISKRKRRKWVMNQFECSFQQLVFLSFRQACALLQPYLQFKATSWQPFALAASFPARQCKI